MRSGESDVFRHYWQHYAASFADLDKIPEGVRERWRSTIAAMPDSRIEWLIRTSYAPPFASDAEWASQHSFATKGTDWTRYAMLPNGTCSTGEDCTRQTRIIARRKCGEYRFRSVTGRVERDGRQVGERPSSIVGIVAFGTREYRGTLIANDGERLSVTWSRRWIVDPANDPLDGQHHRFSLLRLPGGVNWEIERWTDMPDAPEQPALTATNCVAQLSIWPPSR